MKKRILIIILLLFVTGCNVNYNITINDDLSVSDNLVIEGSEYLFSLYEKTSNLNVMKLLIEENNKDIEMLKDIGYNYRFDEEEIKLYFDNKYDNLEDFSKKNLLYSNLFDELSYDKDGDIITIKGIGYKGNDVFRNDTYYLNNFDMSIKTIYKVLDSSCYKFNENTNEFYFNLNDKTSDFDFYIKIDTSKKIIPYFKVYLIGGLCLVGISIIIIFSTVDRKKIKK